MLKYKRNKRMPKMLTARNIASYFIEKSSQLDENNDLTNLKLQKILYYTQAEAVQEFGGPIFDDVIEAWVYGPVVPEIYEWLKGCGAYPIVSFDVECDHGDLDDKDKAFLDTVWETYNSYSAIFLVQKTHCKGEPWKKVFKDFKHNPIDVNSLKSATLAKSW